MSVHEQIQLLKTLRAMIDVLMLTPDKSIMECCGRDLCHALLHPSARAHAHVQEWLGNMILLRKDGHNKGDEEEDVKQDQKILLLNKKKRRRVAFAGDTDFNTSLPSVQDDVDNNNTSGNYVRGPSRAQQKKRKISIQKWNEVYSSEQEEVVETEVVETKVVETEVVETEVNNSKKTVSSEHCLTHFLTGANVRRRAREAACVWLRATALATKLSMKKQEGGGEGEGEGGGGEEEEEEGGGGDILLLLVPPACSASALSVVQLLSESDDHLLLLLSTSVEVMSCAGSAGGSASAGDSLLTAARIVWSPTCLLGHLCSLMGQDATIESLIDILTSPENGIQMLKTLLHIGKWYQRVQRTKQQQVPAGYTQRRNDSGDTLTIAEQAQVRGSEVLCGLRVELIKLERVLPFGVGPLLRVLM